MVPPAGHNQRPAAVVPPPERGAGEAPPIPDDVPCTACGYNLRGLPCVGRCPECGAGVAPSLGAHRARAAPLPPPDARWARQVAEGAALSLVSLGLFLALCVAPAGWFYLPRRDAPLSQTPGRVVLLCLACAGWVAAWYAAWKLTMRPPLHDPLAPRFRALAARWLTTAYFALPVLVALNPAYYKNPPPFPLILLDLLAPLAAAVLVDLVVGLFRRTGGGWARVEALALALALPVSLVYQAAVVTFSHRSHGTRASSLDLLFDLPSVPHLLRLLALNAWNVRLPDALILAAAAVPLWVASLHLRLWLRYRRFAEPGRGSEP